MKNRVKIAYIRPEDIINCFHDPIQKVFTKLKLINMPKDAKIISGWYDPRTNSFAIKICHESFPEIPEFQLPPVVVAEIEMIFIRENDDG